MGHEDTLADQLRYWRRRRGWSQLDLAVHADVSQRHISFIETGRSRPTATMVHRLAATMDVPLREQNVLLMAAGHAPAYRERPLDGLGSAAAAVADVMAAHEPRMAYVVDRAWDVLASTAGTTAFMRAAFPSGVDWAGERLNAMRALFHPDGLRLVMPRWAEQAPRLLRRLRRDAALHPHDARVHEVLAEVLAYPGVSALDESAGGDATHLVATLTYDLGGVQVSLFSTITTFDEAMDLTLSEVRLESHWPVDEDSARAWAGLVGGVSP